MAPEAVLACVPLLPLVGGLLNGLLTLAFARRRVGPPEWLVASIGCLLPLLSCVLAMQLVYDIHRSSHPSAVSAHFFTWIASGSLQIGADLLLDRLSGVMVTVVTGVGFLIHLYSVGYMRGDRGFARYFCYLNLFLFCMLVLVLARNLVLLYIGWEGVGLCSYLLIGFWFQNKQYAIAGNKAFIVNRIGDFGFTVGLFWLYWSLAGPRAAPLDLSWLHTHVQGLSSGAAEGIALLLFLGAVGKSAQIPLYVWLPDAMAGPTPVSALIHAATMVTAGVYLVARLHVLYDLAPVAAETVAIIGTVTALWAALIAVTQNDIKRVLAYSTISQLGYMFMSVGTGAYGTGLFHLFTHAFFKALLFLGAGVLIHGLQGEQDLQRMGGLARSFPLTHICFLAALLAIAGIPPGAGFFSKDAILWHVWVADHPVLWGLGLLTSGLTSFYMFRLYFLAFHGSYRGTALPESHGTPWTMGLPLVVLAAGSVCAGWIEVPSLLDSLVPGPSGWLSRWLAPVLGSHWGPEAVTSFQEALVMGLTVLASLVGIAVAAWLFGWRQPPPERRPGWIYRLVQNQFYVDELYDLFFVRPLLWFSRTVLWKDFDTGLIDGIVNGLPQAYWGLSSSVRTVQSGHARLYALYLLLGLLGLVLYYTVRSLGGGQ